MNTITEQSWNLLNEIRAELKLDSFHSPEKAHEHDVKDWNKEPVKPPMEPFVIDEAPRPGELLRIDWIRKEARRTGNGISTIKMWMDEGRYKERLEFRHVSERRVYVKEKGKR